MAKVPTGKLVAKGHVKTSKPMPKQTYKERLAKPEPDNFMPRPPKPKGNMARMKRLKGAAL